MLYNDLGKTTFNNQQMFIREQSGNVFMQYNAKNPLQRIFRGKALKYFIDTDNKKLFLKESNESETWGEIISSELGQQLGMRIIDPIAVNCVIATPYNSLYDTEGVIMYSYLPDETESYEVISARKLLREYGELPDSNSNNTKFSVFNCLNAIKKMQTIYASENKKLIIDKNIELDHIKLAIFDTITMQSDRHNHNIEYIMHNYKNESSYFEMAPVFDNSLSFQLTFADLIKDQLAQATSIEEKEKVRKAHFNIHGIFLLKNEECYLEDTVKNLAKTIIQNPELQNFVEKINTIDIDQTINSVCNKNGRKIKGSYRIVTREIFNYRKDMLNKAIEKEKNINLQIEENKER